MGQGLVHRILTNLEVLIFTRADHGAVGVKDVEKAITFYRDIIMSPSRTSEV
jgi:hypothetical protein